MCIFQHFQTTQVVLKIRANAPDLYAAMVRLDLDVETWAAPCLTCVIILNESSQS